MSASTSLARSQDDRLPVHAPVPRGEKRRREVAKVAEQVFFELGYANTTMQTIAVRAGASKETLYRHFGSKEGLFAEIVAERSRSFLYHLDHNFERPGSVAEVLRELGVRILESMLEPSALCLCRTVIADGHRNPDLGTIFMKDGPDHVRTRLAEFLRAACSRHELDCPDVEMAARIFLGAVVGSYHLSLLLLGDYPVLSQERIATHVEECVAMVLKRYHCRDAAIAADTLRASSLIRSDVRGEDP